ncbi:MULTISPECIES: EAL domain-containing protein [unclassified Novosphingobium]|uniref:EAL domain-containing protein n=1 Tax=unclassified Novosphingobium TaxID=2644732 RepID=UPI0025F0FFE0|nr:MULTISPECIES: EAL domain-containing protein [unclassified Novosphingobium]HQV02605.1 EAL domain-containing protein [Novosphingobium sp.]
MWPFRRTTAAKKRTTRTRIYVWTLLICVFIAAIDLALPLEGVFRGVRNQVRARPADQSVVVAAIDLKTIQAFGSDYYSREYNAKLLDQVFKAGAKRAYFDEVFSKPIDAAGDRAFAAALARNKGRVFTGAFLAPNGKGGTLEPVWPHPMFAGVTTVRSLTGDRNPASLTAELYYSDQFEGKTAPSIASDIANRHGQHGRLFLPDWSITASSVPTISVLDIVDGKVSPDELRGKDVIVGVTAQTNDFAYVFGQGWIPGVYVHAVGAQTLKEGAPLDIGWIPPMLVAALLALAIVRERSRKKGAAIVVVAVLLAAAAPLLLDSLLIKADYLAAFLMFGLVTYRTASLREISEARLKNAGSLLPNLAALREEPLASANPIIAMRIRNYAAICASFQTGVEDELINELARRLTLPNVITTFYQAEDVLYWLGPQLSLTELEDHLAGLARLVESQFQIRGRKLDIHIAFGVDVELARPVSNRIGGALLAADTAASKHQLVQFNSSANDEDVAWELSLMSELDAAIDAGDIWIAYQPQYNLADDTICGAEALVRWQHPVRGAISPEAFVLPAESHNRISRLTFHILEQATRAAKPMLGLNPHFRLSVNISASLLEQPQLPAEIARVLILTGFPASNLTLEVTESAPFSAHTIIAQNLAGIAAIGIDLSIDDYGTGNATLEYLRTVPCQEIKIDRRFVSGMVTNASDMLLVESTIELAHGLGRRVIAEGIEDPETLEILRSIGCDYAQGYYLAKPMRVDALATLLEATAQTKAA